MQNHFDRCDKCGAETTDLDAGFCPSLQSMGCKCGGTWRRIDVDADFSAGYRDGIDETVDVGRLATDERYRAGYTEACGTVDALRRHIASAPRR